MLVSSIRRFPECDLN